MIRPYFISPLLTQGLKGWTFSQPVVVFHQRRERIEANLIPSLEGMGVLGSVPHAGDTTQKESRVPPTPR